MRTGVMVVTVLTLWFVSAHGETAPAFHGFYYNDGVKQDTWVKLLLTKADEATMKKLVAVGLNELTEEKYWRSFSRFMITPFPQTYIAWDNKTYWVVLADKVGDDHKYVKGKHGIHVFEFSKNKMRYAYRDLDEAQAADHAFESLVLRGHDWSISGEEKKDQKLLSKDEVATMKENIVWTDDVHERMKKKFPPDKE